MCQWEEEEKKEVSLGGDGGKEKSTHSAVESVDSSAVCYAGC